MLLKGKCWIAYYVLMARRINLIKDFDAGKN